MASQSANAEDVWRSGLRQGCLCSPGFSRHLQDHLAELTAPEEISPDVLLPKLSFLNELIVTGLLRRPRVYCPALYDVILFLSRLKFALISSLKAILDDASSQHVQVQCQKSFFYVLCVLPCPRHAEEELECSGTCGQIVKHVATQRQHLDQHGANLLHQILVTQMDQPKDEPLGGCRQKLLRPKPDDRSHLGQVRRLLIHDLKTSWRAAWVNNYVTRCLTDPAEKAGILSILEVWWHLVSVKNPSMTFAQSREFSVSTRVLVNYVSTEMDVLVKKRLLDILNEVLCYGSTLAIQSEIPDEASDIAQKILAVARRSSGEGENYFESLSVPRSHPGMAGNSVFGLPDEEKLPNFQIIQSIVLLHLKAIAVVIRDSQAISSSSEDGGASDSSLSSRGSSSLADEEREINLIANNVLRILTDLNRWMSNTSGRASNITNAVVELFQEQDDILIEALLCLLDISINSNNQNAYFQQYQIHSESSNLASNISATNTLTELLDPLEGFEALLRTVSSDHSVLLDFLLSNETCFLLYFLRLLKFIYKSQQHQQSSGRFALSDQVSEVIAKMRTSIQKLTTKSLFPYDITPVLRLLNKIRA